VVFTFFIIWEVGQNGLAGTCFEDFRGNFDVKAVASRRGYGLSRAGEGPGQLLTCVQGKKKVERVKLKRN